MRHVSTSILCGLTAVVCGFPVAASAQLTTSFDFEAAGADQDATYRPEAGATLEGGVGRIGLLPGWPDPSYPLRARIVVDHQGEAVEGAVVDVPGDVLPSELLEATTAFDVGVFDDTGAPLDAMWAGAALPDGRLRVRVPTLGDGENLLFVYPGNEEPIGTDELTFFRGRSHIHGVGGTFTSATFAVTSLVDDNTLAPSTGDSTTLGALETTTFDTTDSGFSLESTGPVQAIWDASNGDALPPRSFQGRQFVIPAPRYDERIEVVAFEPTTLTFDSPAIADVGVPTGTPTALNVPVDDGEAVVFEASSPVLVTRAASLIEAVDVTPVAPAARELFGTAAGGVHVAAGSRETTVTIFSSAAAEPREVVVPARSTVQLVESGSMGSGPAVRLVADRPIGALHQADGDGTESVTFLQPRQMGLEFAVPTSAQYLAIATITSQAECVLYDAAGMELARQSSDGPDGTGAPGVIVFRNETSGLPAPARLSCSAPAWALLEDFTFDSERLLVAGSNHRPPTGPLVVRTTGVELPMPQSSAIVTPRWTPPVEVDRLTTFDVVGSDDLRFQISFDEGATWRVPHDGEYIEAVTTAGEPADAFAGVAFPPTRSITIRVLLSTESTIDTIDLVAPGEPPAGDAAMNPGDAGDAGMTPGDRSFDGRGGCCASARRDRTGWMPLLLALVLLIRRLR